LAKINIMNKKLWLLYALVTTVFWGIRGALTELSAIAGFPGTLIYVVWSVTMIIPAVIALKLINWKLPVMGIIMIGAYND